MHITDTKKIEKYYKALIERQKSFVGIFIVGVKTTSICCISTCRARKPKYENVEFFKSLKDALESGYRPCKICKPTEHAHRAPKQIEDVIKLVRCNPETKLTDKWLKENSFSPTVLRRWFNTHYGMTFQKFQRMYRINNAFIELKKGKRATHTAYDNGYDSLSGFSYTFKKLIGETPKDVKHKKLIYINRLTTPLGPMFICASDNGLCLLEFVDCKTLEKEFSDLKRLLNAKIIVGENTFIQKARLELDAYFEGSLKDFSMDIDAPGTAFQKKVWRSLFRIPYGETRTYQEQAFTIKKPKAIRAVASANGQNRIAIIIPCHRIIGKNKSMTGYSGGVERKQWLIEHEAKHREVK